MLQQIRDKITGWFAIVFLGVIAIVFTSSFFLSHLLAAWHLSALRAVCAGWACVALGSVVFLIPPGWAAIWCLPPAFTDWWLRSNWPMMRARLVGEDHPDLKSITNIPK